MSFRVRCVATGRPSDAGRGVLTPTTGRATRLALAVRRVAWAFGRGDALARTAVRRTPEADRVAADFRLGRATGAVRELREDAFFGRAFLATVILVVPLLAHPEAAQCLETDGWYPPSPERQPANRR